MTDFRTKNRHFKKTPCKALRNTLGAPQRCTSHKTVSDCGQSSRRSRKHNTPLRRPGMAHRIDSKQWNLWRRGAFCIFCLIFRVWIFLIFQVWIFRFFVRFCWCYCCRLFQRFREILKPCWSWGRKNCSFLFPGRKLIRVLARRSGIPLDILLLRRIRLDFFFCLLHGATRCLRRPGRIRLPEKWKKMVRLAIFKVKKVISEILSEKKRIYFWSNFWTKVKKSSNLKISISLQWTTQPQKTKNFKPRFKKLRHFIHFLQFFCVYETWNFFLFSVSVIRASSSKQVMDQLSAKTDLATLYAALKTLNLKKVQKFPEMSKNDENTQKCPKTSKKPKNDPKTTKNDQNWPPNDHILRQNTTFSENHPVLLDLLSDSLVRLLLRVLLLDLLLPCFRFLLETRISSSSSFSSE